MKSVSPAIALLGLMATTAFGGTTASVACDPFADARRPVTNPTLFDLALPTTNAHAIFLYQNLPGYVNTTLGPVALGGDLEVYALQLEYALNPRLSIVATKDGYVDFNPDRSALWHSKTGFANLAAGLKYAFLYDPASGTVVSGTATFEVPTGGKNVFQGEGSGATNLIVSGLKMWGPVEFAASAGVHLPFDHNSDSTTNFVSAHASYEVSKFFIPLVEVNWFHVLDGGDGAKRYPGQAVGLVPGVAKFEGGDLINFGARNSEANRDFVSGALGFRSKIADSVEVGAAYEIPLTQDNNSLMKNRITADLIWKF